MQPAELTNGDKGILLSNVSTGSKA